MTHLSTAQFSQYRDGTLAAEIRAEADAHLATCAACRTELQFHVAIAQAVKRGPMAEPSFDFTTHVMAQVMPAPAAKRELLWWRNIPMLMMAAGLVLAFIVAATVKPESQGASVSTSHGFTVPGSQSILGVVNGLLGSVAGTASSIVGMLGVNVALVGLAVVLLMAADRALAHRLSH